MPVRGELAGRRLGSFVEVARRGGKGHCGRDNTRGPMGLTFGPVAETSTCPRARPSRQLLALPRLAAMDEAERPAACTIHALERSALRELNAALATAGQVEPSAAARTLWSPLRGHGLAALLAAPQPVAALSARDESLLQAMVAILGNALGFVPRERHCARRLKQVRHAKIAR